MKKTIYSISPVGGKFHGTPGGEDTRETIGLGWSAETRPGRHVGERSNSCKYFPSCLHVVLRRYRVRCPPAATVGDTLAISDLGCVEEVTIQHERSTIRTQDKKGGRRSIVHLLRSGYTVDNSARGSEDKHVRAPMPCAHRGFVHAHSMLERIYHLPSGRAYPRLCIACRQMLPVGS